MKLKIKTSILVSIILYIILNTVVFIQDKHYKNELTKFDLNNDDFFSKNEINPDQKKAMSLVIKDTGRKLAPLTLIPVCFIFWIILFFALKFKNKRFPQLN